MVGISNDLRVVQGCSFAELLEQSPRRYQNRVQRILRRHGYPLGNKEKAT